MLQREKLTVALIALSQGLLDLMVLPIFYFYKDILKVSAAEISIYVAFAMLPWVMKPIFGFLSDKYPLFGYRRKSYLIIMTILEISAIFYIGKFATTRLEVMFCSFLEVYGLVGRNVIAGDLESSRGFDSVHHAEK